MDYATRKARAQRARDFIRILLDPHRERSPSKAELRQQLADATRNTAELAHGKTRRMQAGAPG